MAKQFGSLEYQSLSLNWIGFAFSSVTVIACSRSLLKLAVARSVKKVSKMTVKISVNEIMFMNVSRPVSISELPSSSSSSSEVSGKSLGSTGFTDQLSRWINDGLPWIKAPHLSCIKRPHARRFLKLLSHSGIFQVEQSRWSPRFCAN
jgi:hypothetical protein